MQLIGMMDSPYVRRVAISLEFLGVPFERQAVSSAISPAWHTVLTKLIDLVSQNTIIARNNTPPASRPLSAPRGVTCFWGTQISDTAKT